MRGRRGGGEGGEGVETPAEDHGGLERGRRYEVMDGRKERMW